MKTKNLYSKAFFASALVFCLFFLTVSCGSNDSSTITVNQTGTMEGIFEVGQQMTAANVFVVNFTGSGTATVRAGARNGISVPARQENLSGGTLRVPLTGAPTAIGEHTLFLEVIVGDVTHTVTGIFNVTRNGVGAPPVELTFTHPTEFVLGNARMIPFTIEPRSADVTIVNPTGMMTSVNINRFTGAGVLTLTPRTNFEGGTFQVRATNSGYAAATQVLNISAEPRTTGGKRGVAMSMNVARGNITDNLYKLRPHWFWNWGIIMDDADLELIPEGVEYVPTIFSDRSWYLNAERIARINELYRRGIIRYVRGFNEPDLADQAGRYHPNGRMPIDVALNAWERMSRELEPGIRLISPAESHPRLGADSWMSQFMRGVEERGLRVDYIAIHIYPEGPWENQVVTPIRDVYNLWHRRVWLMETGVRDITSTVVGVNRFSREDIRSYMQRLLPLLEAMPELHRYSWFEPAQGHARLYPGRLIGCPLPCALMPSPCNPENPNNPRYCRGSELTIVGEFYSTVNPNLNIRRRD